MQGQIAWPILRRQSSLAGCEPGQPGRHVDWLILLHGNRLGSGHYLRGNECLERQAKAAWKREQHSR